MTEVPQLNLSVVQAAQSLGVSPRFLRSLIYKGEIPVVKLGRRVLVPVEALREWNRAHVEVGS